MSETLPGVVGDSDLEPEYADGLESESKTSSTNGRLGSDSGAGEPGGGLGGL
jgi:hypothetical protein